MQSQSDHNSAIPWQNTYAVLPQRFFSHEIPEICPKPEMICWNKELAEFLNLSDACFENGSKIEIFGGQKVSSGSIPLAQAYAGHQFGHFVPQLGDGRTILLGELRAQDAKLYDVQLKGAGQTAFSRRGDGKSALGPVLREYLVSEFMHRVGVPSTRALCAVLTGEKVQRAELVPSAVMARIAGSHLRVGTFQYFSAKGDVEALEILLNYAVNRHAPQLLGSKNLPLEFLKWLVAKQAELIAHWMSLGFVHGVMNTDNFSIAGITLDFGPCAFLDEYKRLKVFSSIDRTGRYAYANQAPIAQWNLWQFALALQPLVEKFSGNFEEEVAAVLESFQIQYTGHYHVKMLAKIGIRTASPSTVGLLAQWLEFLEREQLDFSQSHRDLSKELLDLPSQLSHISAFQVFKKELIDELLKNDSLESFPSKSSQFLQGIALQMNQINPCIIPRNHNIEAVIEEANHGDFSPFQDLAKALKEPFTEGQMQEAWAQAPSVEQRVLKTFCGT